MQSINIDIAKLKSNNGQIEGLPKNPRLIKDDKYKKLKKSIEEDPEMLNLRELIVYPLNNEYIVIAGNMRLAVMKELKYKQAPCKVLDAATTVEKLQAYTIKDNVSFGIWDFDILANEWDSDLLDGWGVDIPTIDIDLEDELDLKEEIIKSNQKVHFLISISPDDIDKIQEHLNHIKNTDGVEYESSAN